MKIAIVLPQTSRFDSSFPNSVDSIAQRNLLIAQKFNQSVCIFASASEMLFDQDPYVRLIDPNNFENNLTSALKDFSPDIIEIHRDAALFEVCLPLQAKKTIWYNHDFLSEESLKTTHLVAQNNEARQIICVSKALATHTRQTLSLKETPEVVYNSIVPGIFFRKEKKQKIFFAGRLTIEKGVYELSQALAAFLAQFSDWSAELILDTVDADQNEIDALHAIIDQTPNIDVHTNVGRHEVADRLADAAIAVTPSYREPFGLTALEAHAAGAALISSFRDGLSEISGDAALKCDPITAPCIRMALEKLAMDRDLRQELADRGDLISTRFTPEKCGDDLLKCWSK